MTEVRMSRCSVCGGVGLSNVYIRMYVRSAPTRAPHKKTAHAGALTYGLNDHCVHFVRTELQLVAGEAAQEGKGWDQRGMYTSLLVCSATVPYP